MPTSQPASVLIPKICVEQTQDCKVVLVKDVTGTYANDNINGWGLPNVALSDIVSATLTYQTYNPVTDAFSPVGQVYDVSSILPNLSGVPYQLSIGEDSIYYIVVTYTDGTGVSYTAEYYYTNVCVYECCYAKKVATTCGCPQGASEILEVYGCLQAIKAAGCCGVNIASIQDNIKKLKRLCANCDCGCK